jgi:hypothetical protein
VLKVLQLIPTLALSGAEKQTVLLAKQLPRDRLYVEVAALTQLGRLESELRDVGIPITASGKRFKVDPIALLSLNRFLKAKSFDVVQTWIFAASALSQVSLGVGRFSEMSDTAWHKEVCHAKEVYRSAHG